MGNACVCERKKRLLPAKRALLCRKSLVEPLKQRAARRPFLPRNGRCQSLSAPCQELPFLLDFQSVSLKTVGTVPPSRNAVATNGLASSVHAKLSGGVPWPLQRQFRPGPAGMRQIAGEGGRRRSGQDRPFPEQAPNRWFDPNRSVLCVGVGAIGMLV